MSLSSGLKISILYGIAADASLDHYLQLQKTYTSFVEKWVQCYSAGMEEWNLPFFSFQIREPRKLLTGLLRALFQERNLFQQLEELQVKYHQLSVSDFCLSYRPRKRSTILGGKGWILLAPSLLNLKTWNHFRLKLIALCIWRYQLENVAFHMGRKRCCNSFSF